MKSLASRWPSLALASALSLLGSACDGDPDPQDPAGDAGGSGGSTDGSGGKDSTGGRRDAGGGTDAGETGGSGNSGGGGAAAGGSGGSGGPDDPALQVSVLHTSPVTKLDLLFAIDNSISMADKQAVLKTAIPDLVKRLVSPYCVNSEGAIGATPDTPTAACPSGYAREFTAARDVHVGVITSSLGGHGARNCDGSTPGIRGEQQNDKAHLIATRPRFGAILGQFPGTQVPELQGFLDWNPGAGKGDAQQFINTFQAMVVAAGEFGCGYESQLEAVHRFLSDPAPSAGVEIRDCSSVNGNPCAFPVGIDETLLAQRGAFLRPDSAVGVVLVSDENDCSIQHEDQGYYAARADDLDMPRSTAACAKNPNDVCCVSCISPVPEGCAPDPTCTSTPTTPDELDPPNLRCFQQKRRFGIDFLYPTGRYVNALRSARLCTSSADLGFTDASGCADRNGDGEPDVFDNPLFAGGRDASRVFLAGIVGVPWQDLQADADDAGKAYPAGELHYKSAAHLTAGGVWNKILGNPSPGSGAAPVLPTNALMIESTTPRSGNDGQGKPLAPPDSPALTNPVNSHEWGNTRQDDLQHACVFRLPQPRNCADVALLPEPKPGCDCEEVRSGDFSPLCQNPADDLYTRNQHFAKAYPGLRELQVLKDFGENALVASICARNLTDPTAQDYGYRPAMESVVDRVSEALDAGCLPRPIPEDRRCKVVEVRPPGNTCDADRNRSPVNEGIADALNVTLQQRGACGSPGRPECSELTLCLIAEAGPACHGTGAQPEAGWCYIDPARNTSDAPALVEKCSPDRKRAIRFVDPGGKTPESDATAFMVCEAS